MCKEISLGGHLYDPPGRMCTCCLIATGRSPADSRALAHFGQWIIQTYQNIEKEEGGVGPSLPLEMV